MSTKRKEWVNCLPPNVLREMIERFPNYRPLSIGHDLYGEGAMLAYVLFMAGVKTFDFSIGRVGGDDSRPEYLRIHTNSVIATPYVPNPLKKDEPLLWHLFRKTKWKMACGCAGRDKNYMQVGTQHAPCKDKELNGELYRAVVMFQQFVKHFPR